MVGADDFLPFLIYIVLTADLRHIQSNIRFVERYIDNDEMQGEAYYYFIQLNSAVSYLSSMTNAKAQATIAERREKKREKELRMRQRLSIDSTNSTSSASTHKNNGIDVAYFDKHDVTSQIRTLLSQPPLNPQGGQTGQNASDGIDQKRLNEVYGKLADYAQPNIIRYSGSGSKGRIVCKGAEFPHGARAVNALCISSDEIWVAFDNGKVAIIKGDGKLIKVISLPRLQKGSNMPLVYAQGMNAVLAHAGLGRIIKISRESYLIEDITVKNSADDTTKFDDVIEKRLAHDFEYSDVSAIAYAEEAGTIFSAGCPMTSSSTSSTTPANSSKPEISNTVKVPKPAGSGDAKARRETQLLVVDSKTKSMVSSKIYPGRITQMVVATQKDSSQVWAAFDDGLLACFDPKTGDVTSAITKYQKANGGQVSVSLATNGNVLWLTCDSQFVALSTANFAKTKALTLISSGKTLRPQGSRTALCAVVVKGPSPVSLVVSETKDKPICVWSAVKNTPNLVCEALIPVLIGGSVGSKNVVVGSNDGIWIVGRDNKVFIYSYVI